MRKISYPLFVILISVFQPILSGSFSSIPHFNRYVITNFTAENGLPQNTIDLVEQTKDGYIWIGTYAGLARFDGVRFVHFNRSITPAFSINHVTTFVEDKNGVQWIGTNGGGIVRNEKNNFTAVSGFNENGKGYIRSLVIDENNDILVATERGGIWKISTDQQSNVVSVSAIAENQLPKDLLLRSLIRDGKRLLLATDDGLFILHENKVQAITKNNGLPNNSITALAIDQQNILWIGTSNGLCMMDENGSIKTFTTNDGLTNNAIRTLLVDRNNTVWIGTDGGGVNRFISKTDRKKFDALVSDDGLTNNFVRKIFQDNENNIWIGTRSGLTQLNERKFDIYNKKSGLTDSYVRTVFQDSRKRIWIGTNGSGLHYIDKGVVKLWEHDKKLPNKFIRAIFESQNGNLWFGTDGGGVVRYDEQNNKLTQYSSKNGLTENYIRAFQEGFDSDIWIATYGGGISRLKNETVTPLTTAEGLANNNVLAMVRTSKNEIWVGTNGGGVNKITKNGIETFSVQNGLSNNFILSMYADRDGSVWVGTNGGGLNRISNGVVQTFTTKEGLREDVVLMIIEDEQGFLWVGGNQGISRIRKYDFQDVAEGKLKKILRTDFGREDGLQNAEVSGVSTPSIIRSQDGKIYFATVGGLASVNPSTLNANQQSFPLHIEEVGFGTITARPESTLYIEPGNSTLEFHYTALTYIAPDRIRFRYKLIGFNDDWIDAGKRRTAYYTNLPPGEYTFCVNSTTDNGTWSENDTKVSIVLQPFFHQTRYFVALVGFGLILLGAGLYALRSANIHRHAKLMKALVDERTKDLVEAKDKIEKHLQEVEIARDALTQTNVQLDKANKEKSDLLGILSHDFKNKVVNLNHFAHTINDEKDNLAIVREHSILMEKTTEYMLRLIEDTLSSSALEQGKLVFNKTPVDIVQLVELASMKNRIQMQHKSQQLEYSSAIDHCFVNGSERWLTEAIDNLINNASKFSDAKTTVKVSVKQSNGRVHIAIHDQGPGMTENDKAQLFQPFKRLSAQPTGGEISTGLGLAIVKKIVEMHNGTVIVESEFGKGSTFLIELPIHKNS